MTTLRRERVYDPVLRLIHGWNALIVMCLLVTSHVASMVALTPDEDLAWRLHIWAGYGLTLGLVARLIWGLVGPVHARIADMWRPREWIGAVRRLRVFTSPAGFGHHPLASALYLVVYGVLLVLVVTGLALAAIEHTMGPLVPSLADAVWNKSLFKTPHHVLESVVIGFVIIHMAALVLHRRIHGVPVAQSMFSGYQYSASEQ